MRGSGYTGEEEVFRQIKKMRNAADKTKRWITLRDTVTLKSGGWMTIIGVEGNV